MPNSKTPYQHVDQLIADYVSGNCEPTQLHHLVALVENDQALAAYVGRHLAMHRVLQTLKTTTGTADRVMSAINKQSSSSPDVERLIADYIAGSLNAEEQQHLLTCCKNDAIIAETLNRHLQLHRVLQEANNKAINANVVMFALPQKRDSSLQTRVLKHIAQREKKRRRRVFIPAALAALLLLALLLSYMFMAAVPQPIGTPAVPALPTMAIVTHANFPIIRAGTAAEWPNNVVPYDQHGQLLTTHIDLCAGIAELEMPSGAVMILQGPTLLEITGDNSVRLTLGRLTTYVPKRAVGFTLQAEGLEVIDLGTAFGINQGIDGIADVHVFAGAVEAIASIEGANQHMHLHANEAIRISPRGGKWERVPCDAERFIFSLRPQSLALDLADIIAGGDGFGIGVADGIDPTTGNLMSVPAIGYGQGDMAYHRVDSLMTIDGVFIPNGANSDNQITSLGDRFRFPRTDGMCYDLIRRGGTYDMPRHGGDPKQPGIPPIFGGIDYRTAGHSAIGMHANVGFTIDLQAVAYRHPQMHVASFKTMLANVGFKGSSGSADFWVFVDGQLVRHEKKLTAMQSPRPIEINLTATHRYLTLVSTDGENSMSLDWVTLGDPKLYLGPQSPNK